MDFRKINDQLDVHTGKLNLPPQSFHDGIKTMERPDQRSIMSYELSTETGATARLNANGPPSYDMDAAVGNFMSNPSKAARENFAMGGNYSFYKDGSDQLSTRHTDAVGILKYQSTDLTAASDKSYNHPPRHFY